MNIIIFHFLTIVLELIIFNLSAGSYSQAKLHLVFDRKYTYHLLRIYLPSLLLVIVSGISISIPLTHSPGSDYTNIGKNIMA